MRIGIIGAGHVGTALADGLARHGHHVMLGTRDVGKPAVREFIEASGGTGSAGSYADAAGFGDVVITAYPGRLEEEMVAAMGAHNLAGKIIIDAVNPIGHEGGKTVPAYGYDDSAAEVLQRAVPSARVVKAYDTVNPDRMVDPDPATGPTTMKIAGDDVGAKAEVTALLESTGWSVRDMGGLEQARKMELRVVAWVQRMEAEPAES
jgi:predicted dinucleotide-binding enzyme